MVVILDKNTDKEVRFPADNVYERILYNTFNAIKTYSMEPGKVIPAIPQFYSQDITTVEVQDDNGAVIPLTNTYNKVLAVSSHIDNLQHTITYSMDLGRQ